MSGDRMIVCPPDPETGMNAMGLRGTVTVRANPHLRDSHVLWVGAGLAPVNTEPATAFPAAQLEQYETMTPLEGHPSKRERISEPDVMRFGICPFGHPRSTRVTVEPNPDGDGFNAELTLWCTGCASEQ